MVELKLIEHGPSKQLCFAKRRNGLVKKALELHLLCDVDAVVIAFSPAGRLSYFCGANRRIEDIIGHFAALPEDIRQFHIPDLELGLLLEILDKLKEQTKEHIQNDSTISAIQNELCQVKEEIWGVLIETRRYEPLHAAIMTMEEANRSEKILEETLARIQERKQELTAKDKEDASKQLSDAMNGAENSLPKLLDEVQQAEPEHQVNENYDENQHQSPTAEGIQDTLMRQSSPSKNLLPNVASPILLPEVASPNPQHAGTSFTSLLNAVDVAEETASPFRGLFSSQPLDQNHNASPLQQNQFDIFQDGLLESYSYPNGNTTGVDQSSECNEIRTDGTANGNNSPAIQLQPSPNLQLQPSPASLQLPQYQMQLPMPTPHYYQISQQRPLGSSSNMSPFITPPWYNQTTLQQNPTPFVQNPQWSNQITLQQNPTPVGHNAHQRPNNQGMYPDSRAPVFLSGPSHLQLSRQRKSTWQDDYHLGLASYQTGNTAPNNIDSPAPIHIPDPRPIGNAVYSPAYAHMGLAVDPHIRNFQEIRYDKGRGQQGNQ